MDVGLCMSRAARAIRTMSCPIAAMSKERGVCTGGESGHEVVLQVGLWTSGCARRVVHVRLWMSGCGCGVVHVACNTCDTYDVVPNSGYE